MRCSSSVRSMYLLNAHTRIRKTEIRLIRALSTSALLVRSPKAGSNFEIARFANGEIVHYLVLFTASTG